MLQTFKQSPALWGLLPLLVLTPALTCVTPKIMTAMYLVFGLITVLAFVFHQKKLPSIHRGWFYGIGVFAAFGMLGSTWSLLPENSFSKSLELSAMFLMTGFLFGVLKSFDASQRKILGVFLATGFILGCSVYYFEMLNNFPLYDLVRGGISQDVPDIKQNKALFLLTLWALMAIPFLFIGQRLPYKIAYILGFAALFFATILSKSASSQLILAGLPFLIAALRFIPTRANVLLIFSACTAITLFMPVIGLGLYKYVDWKDNPLIPSSLESRIEIWNQTADRTREKPLLGWGLDTARALPNRGEVTQIGPKPYELPIAHLHPHNAPLQIWFELGGFGIAGAVALFVALYFGVLRLGDDMARRYALFMWTTIFLYTLSIWGIWQSWFVCALCFASVMSASSARALDKPA